MMDELKAIHNPPYPTDPAYRDHLERMERCARLDRELAAEGKKLAALGRRIARLR